MTVLEGMAGNRALRAYLAPLAAVLLSAGILIAGHGLLNLLVPLRAQTIPLDPLVLGLLGSGYFAGYLIAGFIAPRIIGRVGHIRSFAVAAAIGSTTSLALTLGDHPVLWVLARTATGAAMATLYMVIESWLNERSDGETRATVFGIYMIVNFVALSLGQIAVSLIDPAAFVPFVIGTMLITLSLIPVSMTSAVTPSPLQNPRFRLAPLWRNSPVSVVGSVLSGISHGAFWTISPIFVADLGFSTPQIAQFMALSILGGALAQYPIGRLSDVIDRRMVLCGISAASIAFSILLVTAQQSAWPIWLFQTIAVGFGGFMLPMYSLLVAHANDHAEPGDFVNTSTGLLLLFGAGSVVGPTIAAQALGVYGPAGFVGHITIALGLLIGYTLLRLIISDKPSHKEPFVVASRTSPIANDLDPRGPESVDALASEADPGASEPDKRQIQSENG